MLTLSTELVMTQLVVGEMRGAMSRILAEWASTVLTRRQLVVVQTYRCLLRPVTASLSSLDRRQELDLWGDRRMFFTPFGRSSTFSTAPLADTSLNPLVKVLTRKLLLDTRLSMRGSSGTVWLLLRSQPFLVRSYMQILRVGCS